MNSAKKTGAWIFVSHSHRDLDKVREIRNYLELRGHNPLLFFLKCLNDDDTRLPELIRDEIKERDWFVLCDSPNAKASKYVPKEVALVQAEKSPETIATIDLTQELKPQLYKLDRLLKRATVFISYAAPDREIARLIRQALLQHDYCVWTYPDDLSCGSDWATAIRASLDEAAKQGFVMHLLSPEALASQHFESEVVYAFQQSTRMNVLPVTVAPFEREGLQDTLRFTLEGIQSFDLTTGPIEKRIEALIHNLKTREME